MIDDKKISSFAKLDADSRHILQLCAIGDKSSSRRDLQALSNKAEWRCKNGKKLTAKGVGEIVNKLLKYNFLEYGSYGSARICEDIQDFVVQDAVRRGCFATLSDIVQAGVSEWHRDRLPRRDQRIAFYRGDTDAFLLNVSKQKKYGPLGLLKPFSRDILDGLKPELREWYLQDTVPRIILKGDGDPDILAAFEETSEGMSDFSTGFLAAWLDLAVAQGSLESLSLLDELTNRKLNEVHGCIALLKGDIDQALRVLGAVMPGGKRRGTLAPVGHLPGLLQALLLLSKGSPDALGQAHAITGAASKARNSRYPQAMEIVGVAIAFKQSPSSAAKFAKRLRGFCRSPLETLLAGYFANWLLTDDDDAFRVPNLAKISETFRTFGLDWFSAEALGLAAKSGLKSSARQNEKHRKIHDELGTFSLVDLAAPEPVWQRSLNAIAGLVVDEERKDIESPTDHERIIWELDTGYASLNLEVFHQKRKGRTWSKGRKVALTRLYEEFKDPAVFGFLTEQDLEICRGLEMVTERSYRGYPETYCFFKTATTARALIGHPRVFPAGDRERPLEIVEQVPQLRVSRSDGGPIELSIDPKPTNDTETHQMRVESSHRVVFVFFNGKHLELHRMLGGTLKVPGTAANQVLESVQRVASLISVHSEIGDPAGEGARVDADARPHVHLLPYQEGLQVEFYVHPFGDDGPFFRPGRGGENIFANIGGLSKAATRDLAEELRCRGEVLGACPELASRLENETSIFCPTPEEALDALIELEDFAATDRAVLHWPRGRSLSLAGRASSSSLHLHIRKDRDMFAASGNLKVNPELSLDLMQLIDLVDASPTRFVRLDDGRFLALTEQLRRRIEELSLYGDRHTKQKKLRFPPVRATVLEGFGDAIRLKSDSHWKDWLKRIREAADAQVAVPSTLRTELRDYQHEGFQWLARLAAWGVGGCLADDMGLGKTIQALSLLLHRAPEGPALVVAPTSVAFNWIRETERFAPTLDVHLFGGGDRGALLKKLGPRDLVICTYGLLNTEAERLRKIPWHTVVLDEAQLIKNKDTLRSQAAMGLIADFRLIMTGTPLENHLGEVWNLFEFINPGLLGSAKRFQERFATPIETDSCPKTRRRLKRLIQPFILRRTKSQVLEELPPRTEVVRKVELSDEEAALYEALRRRAVEKLRSVDSGGGGHLQILAEIMRLRRACCHPRLVLKECEIVGAKLALFSETIDELLANRHKVLVFSQFVDHLLILRDELERKDIAYQYLDGSTPLGRRKQSIESFQAGQGDVFLISLKAGGLGLNLTAADYVIHMDPWWNPAVEDQASDRAHRLGQLRPVTIYRFITKGTVEEKIAALHKDKRALADSLLEGADMSGKLSAEELLCLIRE